MALPHRRPANQEQFAAGRHTMNCQPALAPTNRPANVRRVSNRREESIEHICGLLGARVTAQQMKQAVDIRLRLTRHALTPKPDAIATFEQLRADGFKIGLLSNCSIEIPIVWPETEFAELFHSTVFSSRERI